MGWKERASAVVLLTELYLVRNSDSRGVALQVLLRLARHDDLLELVSIYILLLYEDSGHLVKDVNVGADEVLGAAVRALHEGLDFPIDLVSGLRCGKGLESVKGKWTTEYPPS